MIIRSGAIIIDKSSPKITSLIPPGIEIGAKNRYTDLIILNTYWDVG